MTRLWNTVGQTPSEVVAYTDTKLLRTPDNDPQWQSTIDLTVRGLTGNPTARRRASYRMVLLVDSDLLTEDESQKIASALWDEHYTAPDGLPENTDLYDWEFLHAPGTHPRPSAGKVPHEMALARRK